VVENLDKTPAADIITVLVHDRTKPLAKGNGGVL